MQDRFRSRRNFLGMVASTPLLWPLESIAALTEEVEWLDEVQRPSAPLPADLDKLPLLLVDHSGRSITAKQQWKHHRQSIRKWWLDFLRPIPVDRSAPPKLTILETDRPQNVIRKRLRYEVEPGLWTEAYLLMPADAPKARPGVLVLHSTVEQSIFQPAGVEGRAALAFGLKLAQRGFVTFCPRNFLWPDNHQIAAKQEAVRFHQRRPESKGMAKMLFDAQVALDILADLPAVDAARLGAVGHSLGAKEVVYLAALDERVKVTVSSEGGIGTSFSNWDAPWYLGSEIKDPDFVHEHHELLALVAPRAFLLIGGDSADGIRSWPYVESALEVYRLYDDRPRLGLLNHGKGHSVPPLAERRIFEWIQTYL